MFDRDNRRRVANSLPDLIRGGRQLIITTNDPSFSKQLTHEIQSSIGLESFDHRKIHPLKPLRDHIKLGLFSEDIEDKRNKFLEEKNRNDDGVAKDYVNELRIYLEEMLIDFFEGDWHKLPKKPTLSDLINAVRMGVTRGIDLFTKKAFQELSKDSIFKDGSDFLDLLNRSHHGDANTITFNEIWMQKDNCERARELIDNAYAEYEYWLRRDIKISTPIILPMPQPTKLQDFNVPEYGELAAFAESPIPINHEADQVYFNQSQIGPCSLYFVNTHNFGFAGPLKCRAIVDLSENEIQDNSLIIAIDKTGTFAGRLHIDPKQPEMIVLSSDAEDIKKRPPTKFFRSDEVRLMKVKGMLFDDRESYTKHAGDVWEDTTPSILERIQLVFRVHGDSALPLALDGQIVFGGKEMVSSDLDGIKGKLVAINSSDGPYLKRVGEVLTDAPHVRYFEAIGGRGKSILLRVEPVEDQYSKLPTINSIREILGVLYEMNFLKISRGQSS